MKSTLFASIISDTTNCTYIFSVDIFVYPTATAFCFPSAITACVTTFKDLNHLSRNSKSIFIARIAGDTHRRLSLCSGGGVGTSHVSWDRFPPLPWTSDLGTYLHIRPGDLCATPWHQTWDLPPPLLLTSGGHHWRPVQTCSLEDLPLPQPVLKSSGGHRNMYSWQMGGTHPIGMLSCYYLDGSFSAQ